MLRYLIFDTERHQVVVDGIEADEQADAKLAELIEEDAEAKGRLIIIGTLERERTLYDSR